MIVQKPFSLASAAKAGLLLLFLLPILSCGGSKSRPGATVTGLVTYKGDPLPAGKVTFFGEHDQVANAMIGPDGIYESDEVPLGPVKIAVTTPGSDKAIENAAKSSPGGKRFGKGNPIVKPGNTVSIPAKYGNPAQSNLSLTVHEGSQPFDIELK
jgi:hypothetical protein